MTEAARAREERPVPARDPSELRALLDELHAALESADSVDPAVREPLREVMQEIGQVLETRGGEREGEERPSLEERVEEMALTFEMSHPTIAGVLNRLTHLLSSMGI